MIHVNRDRRALGQFAPEDVTAGLRSGQLLPTDLGWREGMPSWQPLSEFTDLPEPEEPPTAPPFPGEPVATEPVPLVASELPGTEPAWERREEIGLVAGIGQSIRQVLLEPVATFKNLKKTGGFLDPLMFSYPISLVCGLISLLYYLAYLRFLPENMQPETGQGTFEEVAVSLIYVIPMMLVGYLVLPFLQAGMCHLGLMLIGGVKGSFETTFRVVCYFSGAFAVVALIPFPPVDAISVVMVVIVLSAVITYMTIGLREAHGVKTGIALMAALMPMAVCCACGLALIFGAAAVAAGMGLAP